jgi:hypothetical protein
MLGFIIKGGLAAGYIPYITVSQGKTNRSTYPSTPTDSSYWIAILDANNPVNKVKDFVVPGTSNTAVPAGLDSYMSNPAYLFAVATQSLTSQYVPQGDFYDYLAAHGAGRELQRLEQLNMHNQCGTITQLSYVLIGQGGPPNSGSPAYEQGSTFNPALMVMSLMPLPNGQPPYSFCDSYTYVTR